MPELTVAELADAYQAFARTYYVKHGRPTTEVEHIGSALRAVVVLHGDEPVSLFGPRKLKAVRQLWVEKGLVRTQINKRVGRVRRMFAWGVEEEVLSATVLVALGAVKGLRAGRSRLCPLPRASGLGLPCVAGRRVRLPKVRPVAGFFPSSCVDAKPIPAAPTVIRGECMDRSIDGCFCFEAIDPSRVSAAPWARTTTGHAHGCMPVKVSRR